MRSNLPFPVDLTDAQLEAITAIQQHTTYLWKSFVAITDDKNSFSCPIRQSTYLKIRKNLNTLCEAGFFEFNLIHETSGMEGAVVKLEITEINPSFKGLIRAWPEQLPSQEPLPATPARPRATPSTQPLTATSSASAGGAPKPTRLRLRTPDWLPRSGWLSGGKLLWMAGVGLLISLESVRWLTEPTHVSAPVQPASETRLAALPKSTTPAPKVEAPPAPKVEAPPAPKVEAPPAPKVEAPAASPEPAPAPADPLPKPAVVPPPVESTPTPAPPAPPAPTASVPRLFAPVVFPHRTIQFPSDPTEPQTLPPATLDRSTHLPRVVVVDLPKLNLHSKPSFQGHRVKELRKGMDLQVHWGENGWLQVTDATNTTGWVMAFATRDTSTHLRITIRDTFAPPAP
ncbi:MAG: SH3 domain-containing protein [Magnetococcales bacterium]|nr:SH3 domain-containing protein [Magnetococcales bacterium]NGZ07563.1 SH3 domain-containing protein [Magnetococcales bacterium]